MKFYSFDKLLLFTCFAIILCSCGSANILPEGAYRLKKNRIVIVNSELLKASEFEPYLRQKANTYYFFGWNPFISIYNLSNSKNEGWNEFAKKIGQAPVEFDKEAVDNSVKNILNHAITLGYYDAVISDSIVYKKRTASVLYRIYPGDRFRINKLDYKISDNKINEIVLNDTLNSKIKSNPFLSESTLLLEAERIALLLREKGYYNFTNNYISFTSDTNRNEKTASLTLYIKNFTRNEEPKNSKPHKLFKINKITIQPDYDPSEKLGTSPVEYDTIQYKKGMFVIYKDRLKIRPKFVEQINKIEPYSYYKLSDVTNTYNRFKDINLFTGTNIRFDEVPDNESAEIGLVDCSIKLTPSKTQGYTLNLELSSNSNNLFGISPAVSYFHKNLFNGGEWLNLSFMGNFQVNINSLVRSTELGVSTSLSIPNFLLIPETSFTTSIPRTEFKFLLNYQDRPEFTRSLVSAAYGYNWKSKHNLRFNFFPVQLSVVKLTNLSSSFYQSLENPFIRNSYRNYFDLGAGFNMYYISEPNPKTDKSVFYLRWNNDIAGNLLSLLSNSFKKDSTGKDLIGNTPYSQYIKSEITLGYNKKLAHRTSLAFRFNAGVGYAYGNSSSMPFEKLFYAGGANSLRGWQARSVGPGYSQIDTTFSIPNQTGDIKLEANVEIRFPVFDKFEGAFFADAGNIWNIKRENTAKSGNFSFNNFYKNIALNWGTGIRYDLSFVILRLDLGIIAYDPANQKWISPNMWFKPNSYSLQFGVGYPF